MLHKTLGSVPVHNNFEHLDFCDKRNFSFFHCRKENCTKREHFITNLLSCEEEDKLIMTNYCGKLSQTRKNYPRLEICNI